MVGVVHENVNQRSFLCRSRVATLMSFTQAMAPDHESLIKICTIKFKVTLSTAYITHAIHPMQL